MANSCIIISALPDKYKEWIKSTSKELTEKGVNHTEAQLEKIWLDRISEQDASGLMAYIHNPDRGARTALQFNGSSPKEIINIVFQIETTLTNNKKQHKPFSRSLNGYLPLKEREKSRKIVFIAREAENKQLTS